MEDLLTVARTTYRPLECRPDSYRGWYQQGQLCWLEGNVDEALLCYHRALEYYPNDYWAWYHLAIAHEKLGHVDEAINRLPTGLCHWPRKLLVLV